MDTYGLSTAQGVMIVIFNKLINLHFLFTSLFCACTWCSFTLAHVNNINLEDLHSFMSILLVQIMNSLLVYPQHL